MPDCINLKERFGDQFKIGKDPAYFAEYGPNAYIEDPQYHTVECQHGHIFPWGGETLAVSTNNRGPIANAIAALDCCTVVQDGSDGITATFPVASFDEVAPIIRARRKRKGRKMNEVQLSLFKEMGIKNLAAINAKRRHTNHAPEIDRKLDKASEPIPEHPSTVIGR